MPKIVLIEPQSPNLHIFSKFPSPRLGTILLGTIMKKRGWDVELFVEDFRALDFGVIGSADIVGVSTITSTAPRAYAIADRVRAMGIPVLFGGPHVTFLPDEGLRARRLRPARRSRGDPAGVSRGLARRRGFVAPCPGFPTVGTGRIVHNPKAAPPRDLDAFPFADFDLLKPDRRWRNKKMVLPVQTSRGCPFDCSFCSVTGMFGKSYRFRSTEHIIEELRLYTGAGTISSSSTTTISPPTSREPASCSRP